jgi:hypothetical protein
MSETKPNVFPQSGENKPSGEPEQPVTGVYQIPEEQRAAAEELKKRADEEVAARNAAIEASKVVEQPKPVAKPQIKEPTPHPLAEPKWDAAFDLVPLPSKGKLYKGVRESVKVSYMTGSDENILTSPNLVQSGKFLEILISRNLLEPNLKYKDLHVGDRNALMIWLRASAFGNMYDVTVFNDKYEEVEGEVDLSELKYKPLGAEPDDNGLFDFKCPVSGEELKFKFLTAGDEDEIEAKLAQETKDGVELNNRSTYTLHKQIMGVNGDFNSDTVKKSIENMRIGDIKAFRTYVDNIESGIDLKVQVRTSGGESVSTFLPIESSFFWPDL